MTGNPEQGTLFVISAPSGTGKSTLVQRLLRSVPDLAFSVSFTTRPPRDGERPAEDYHFVEEAEFDRMVAETAFLEWATVHGQRYGTGLERTREALSRGRDLVLDVDVQGARSVREGPVPSVSIMILPPDYATLEKRLLERGSEAQAERDRRLSKAREEVEQFDEFDFLVINDNLDRTVDELRAIVAAERSRSRRRAGLAMRILESFPRSTRSE